jgi:hypothetical protein
MKGITEKKRRDAPLFRVNFWNYCFKPVLDFSLDSCFKKVTNRLSSPKIAVS